MATLIIDNSRKTPGYLIQWREGIRRPSIYLGGHRFTKKTAEELKTIVENLQHYRYNGITVFDRRTAVWLETAHPDLLSKLAKAGLYSVRKPITCKMLWTSLIDNKTDVKPNTLKSIRNVERHFFEEFSQAELIEQITPDRLLEWKKALLREHASSSVRSYLLKTKEVFGFAVKQNWLAKSPMADIPIDSASKCVNREKVRIITAEEYAKLLTACPTQEWRVIVALARWIGLRGPSEVFPLRWSDIVTERNGVYLHAPKTERHAGHQGRIVPLFREVRVELEKLRMQNKPADDDFVIQNFREKSDTYFGKQFHKFWCGAGLDKIEEPFRNMRRTRSNEIRIKYGLEKESEWLGHSERVMRTHYLDLSTDDFTDIVSE